MIPRLPIPPSRVLLIAQAAEVCRATVDRYRHGLPLRRAQERAIERAVRDMPAEAQMSLDSLVRSDKRPLRVLVNPPVTRRSKSVTEMPHRRRLTILDEHGAPVAVE